MAHVVGSGTNQEETCMAQSTSTEVDPIFAAIERHGAAWAAYVQALNAQEHLAGE
jgi:hypothetical protein